MYDESVLGVTGESGWKIEKHRFQNQAWNRKTRWFPMKTPRTGHSFAYGSLRLAAAILNTSGYHKIWDVTFWRKP